jgi:hypothetical protein
MTTHFKDYDVTLTIRVSTKVTFARGAESELAPIRKVDAIDNAIGALPDLSDITAAGFEITYPIDGEANER